MEMQLPSKELDGWAILKILNLYIILLCTHLNHFFPVSIHYYLIGINQGAVEKRSEVVQS